MRNIFIAIACMFAVLFVSMPQAEAASKGQLIIINKSTNELAFFENGELVKTFPVATGRTEELTPEGRFPIVNKIKNRPYYTGGIPGGDPRNPLGDRWLGIHARGTYGTTYAIHGNNNPDSIGKYVSAGCVRMHNSDIHWLFDRVKLYTDVIIVSSSKSFEQIAADYGYETLPPIKIMIDGKEMSVTTPPFMENYRVLVPMRSVFQALGATVVWNGETKTITASKDNKQIRLKVGSKKATVDGKSYTLDVAPQIINGHTFVPTRFVSEALGATVKWDGKKRIVSLTSPKGSVVPKETKQPMELIVNHEKIANGSFLENGISFIPVRDVFQQLGISFTYDAKKGKLEANQGSFHLQAKVGENEATINGEQTKLQAAPIVYEGKLYIPARAISDTFPVTLMWEKGTLHLIQ